MHVKLGDRVRRGQVIAQDRRSRDRRAGASGRGVAQGRAKPTIRQREADLNLALTNVERSRNLYGRQLLPKQTLDDAEARYTSAVAQLDLAQRAARAVRRRGCRSCASISRNTNVVSPVDGFVAQAQRRSRRVGLAERAASSRSSTSRRCAWSPTSSRRTCARSSVGDPAHGRSRCLSRREVQRPHRARLARSSIRRRARRRWKSRSRIREFRLKPGMYAKVNLEVESRENVLIVPKISLVDSEGQRGVYQPNDDNRAQFKPVKVGIEDNERAEILEGLQRRRDRSCRPAPARCAATISCVVAGQRGAAARRPGGARAVQAARPVRGQPAARRQPGRRRRGRTAAPASGRAASAGRRPQAPASASQQRPVAYSQSTLGQVLHVDFEL